MSAVSHATRIASRHASGKSIDYTTKNVARRTTDAKGLRKKRAASRRPPTPTATRGGR